MKLSIVTLLAFGALLSGCTDKCEAALDATSTVVSIKYVKTGGSVSLFDAPTTYAKDSVRVRDEQGNDVPLLIGASTDGYITFGLFNARQTPTLNTISSRKFLIYLKHNDQDTLRADYELVSGECAPEFKKLRVFYNEQLVHDSTTPNVGTLVEKKPW